MRQSAVWQCPPGGHEVAAQPHRYQQVCHAVHVHVADLAPAHAKLDAAEAVR